MPGREEHLKADMIYLGREFPDVHNILDQFAHFPDAEFLRRHRKFLHHAEGIEYIRMRFGDLAGESAYWHVKMDCNHIPNMVDYHIGKVNEYGHKR